ncbi:hypothetical protein GO003_010500 [Methylicorpusculum oleiharenae]|uniref:hypothetical protein n=1 Tax=Methylicorpusculum oleiharenae TaxID=1338687 RepID=UPI00135BE01D|nr:hypothetical protein [Methylicorpusculum oleiharenae]MCD2450820.1 hypothetical protein [Methylicorpusculum oleiharenae]
MKGDSITQRYGIIVFCVSGLVAILAVVLSVDGLGPIDDHQFIRTIFQGKPFGFYIRPDLGRFIPLTAQEYDLAARIIEPSPFLFHFIGGIKVLLCGVLLFYCLMLTRANSWALAILWCVTMYSIGFANAAIRLQIGELNALFLILVFVWSTLVSEKMTSPFSSKQNIITVTGLVALAVAFFYKELIFVFALAFGTVELLRYCRQKQGKIPIRIWALLIIGACYIIFYGLWRVIFATSSNSYTSLHTTAIWDVINLYAKNDPFIIFIVLPLTFFRVLLIIHNANKHTVYDSFMVAASAYVGAFLALRMFNTYYLLPVYGFAVCGIAGILASQAVTWFNTIVLVTTGLLGANTLPVAISDIQSLKSIANNHYQFVQVLSKWLIENPLPNSERRNLILKGVSQGSGIEIIISLKTFLESLGTPSTSFEIKTTEPDDNKNISSYYGVKDEMGYTANIGDLLVFNPYQSVVITPPLLAPSSNEIYRSGSEWALPRWSGWDWLKICVFSQNNCASGIFANMRYTGYAAMLVHRLAAPVQLAPLSSPSYCIDPLELPSTMQAGITKKLDVSIENTGSEIWPANGVSSPGMFVHLSYVWINENGQVTFEGNRSTFPEPIQPNDKTKVSILLNMPMQPGRYKLFISPVQENVGWFYTQNNSETTKVIDIYR